MAHCYPEQLPSSVIADPKRSAERKVYQALAQLPETFTVFYSVAWQVRDWRNGARDGEADFIVAHPDLGVIILEVKGGEIQYDATLGQWFSRDRNGIIHEIKDPVQQARNSKGALLAKLNELPDWNNRWLTLGYMAIFPDVDIGRAALRFDLPREIIMDSTDLEQVEAVLRRSFVWYAGHEGTNGALGIDRLPKLVNLLGRSFMLRTPLGVILAEEETHLIELTEQQMGVLYFIQQHRRALIEGCAGSGKTMLALEKAQQLTRQGFSTLLLCFNAPLAEYLRQRTPEGVDVFHFHDLCRVLSKQAGIGFRSSGSEQEYYDRVLPEMLLDAISELGPQYDAIIVDEGQDFLDSWWEILFFLLNAQDNGIFYVLYDSNQNIYHRPANLSQWIGTPPLVLWENCRNTRAIHQIVSAFHHDPASLGCRAPSGREPEFYFYSDENQQERYIRGILYDLVSVQRIDASHIVLLTTRSPDKTPFHYGKKLGNFKLINVGWSPANEYDLRVSSVHRFKGLESRVILLTGLEDNDPGWLNPILYVACSRARTHLVVIAHERTREQITSLLSHVKGRGIQ